MQISHFCQILLHFSVFCIGLVLVLADKRCLQSNSDGTDMLLLYSVYAYYCSVDLPTLLIAYGGGYLAFPGSKPFVCLVNNYTQILFSFLSKCRSLRAGFTIPFQPKNPAISVRLWEARRRPLRASYTFLG